MIEYSQRCSDTSQDCKAYICRLVDSVIKSVGSLVVGGAVEDGRKRVSSIKPNLGYWICRSNDDTLINGLRGMEGKENDARVI